MSASNNFPVIYAKWVEAHVFCVLHPDLDMADAIYIKGKDLHEFRDWLKTPFASDMIYEELPQRPDPNNIYDNIVLLFRHEGAGTASFVKVQKDIAKIKLVWGVPSNFNLKMNFDKW